MPEQDFRLQLFNEILRNNHAHYGLWEEGEEHTLANLRRAMDRYSEKIIITIPDGVKRILDVGCGWGGNALKLREKGYEVVALSPDTLQQKHFLNLNADIPFVLSRFEDYNPENKHNGEAGGDQSRIRNYGTKKETFDLILFSESCQYIDIQQGAVKAREILTANGYVLTLDYFLKPGVERKVVQGSGHYLNEYLKVMQQHGFELLKEEDITDAVAPTLDVARVQYEEVFRPVMRFFFNRFRQRYPLSFKVISFFLKRMTKGTTEKIIVLDDTKAQQVIDSDVFKKHKRYMLYLFRKR